MPNLIDISASSMTGLLGAVEASKAAHNALAQKSSRPDPGTDHEYDISRYKKGSSLTKNSNSSKIGDRLAKGSNKGVKSRAFKDTLSHKKSVKLSTVPPSVQDQLAMEALERKSKIYEATILGKKGGLSEKQLEACPLDIDAKRANIIMQEYMKNGGEPESDGEDDSDEDCVRPPAMGSSSTLPPTSFTGRLSSVQDSSKLSPMFGEDQQTEEDWIETKDEFGRDILVPASQVKPSKLDPQHTMAFSQTQSASHLQEIGAQYGPQTSFPVLEPRPSTKKSNKEEEPIEKYFDPKAERRQLGTAFYALSSNPEERQRQQEELRARESQTNLARASNAAAASSQTSSEKLLTPAQLAIENRKRQLLLKKEELARKRSKKSEDTTGSTA